MVDADLGNRHSIYRNFFFSFFNCTTTLSPYLYAMKDRYHRVKLGTERSGWKRLRKGTPQGSAMGPFAYNAHTNDLILVLASICDIFNYADDNTVSCYDMSAQEVLNRLNDVVSKMLAWFSLNEMKVNSDKFQLILFNRQGVDQTLTVNVGESIIEHQPVVKLLGLHVDNLLNFNAHIDVICRKAGRKLNVLSRLSKSTESKFRYFILSL